MNLATIKAWLLPLARTFLATALATVVAGLASVTSVPAIWPLICGAMVAGMNAVVLVLQHVAPGVPNPKPPVA
jgi:hypothetical protein